MITRFQVQWPARDVCILNISSQIVSTGAYERTFRLHNNAWYLRKPKANFFRLSIYLEIIEAFPRAETGVKERRNGRERTHSVPFRASWPSWLILFPMQQECLLWIISCKKNTFFEPYRERSNKNSGNKSSVTGWQGHAQIGLFSCHIHFEKCTGKVSKQTCFRKGVEANLAKI